MAKKLVKNYVFSPGLGLSDNLRPNAYSLISQNKIFLTKEITGFATNQVLDSVKCARDLGYIIDGAGFDITLGTNYNSVFLGLAEYNSQEVTPTVIRTIQRAAVQVTALTAVSSNATALSRANTFFNEVVDIGQNGRSAADIVTYTNPTSGSNASRIAAKDRLVANRNFMAAEINAWVAQTYPSADHDPVKCSRDVKYAIDALAYDVLYGGNSATWDQARFFFYGFADGSPGIDPTHRLQTVAAYNRLQDVVAQVVSGSTVTRSNGGTYLETQDTSGSNADGSTVTILENLIQLTEDVVAATNQTAANAVLAGVVRAAPSVTWSDAGLQTAKTSIDSNKASIIDAVNGFANYVFDIDKCERDSGYVIDGLLHDLRYGGNEETRRVSSFYWEGNVPQIDGTRLAELESYYFLTDLINTHILTNVVDATPQQLVATQIIDETKTSEADADDTVAALLQDVIDVIQFGLSQLPELVTGVGSVEVLGKIALEDILIISNVVTNEVIYNFAEPSKGGICTFRPGNSENYPQAESVNNGTTKIQFKYNTSLMSVTDSIQIFLENSELKVRPYDFGTDAIERMRVAQPQAMIDADFEYGLQPTKWQAIGTQRGYPSTFELSATDTGVVNVVTDASTGTSGVGASLITVTTQGNHGFTAGNPITIRALAAAITGFNRAEGTFLIFSTPTPTTFTYYAKSKVGTTNGQVLATTTTQLRQAAFYTGASVGNATFSVATNGSSGSFTTGLFTPSGSTTLSWTGTLPSVGAPLTATGITVGTQVTGVFGDGGTVGTFYVRDPVSSGSSVISLTDTTDILEGMAISDGSGSDIQLVITDIESGELTLNDSIAVSYDGDVEVYGSEVVNATNYLNGVGINATFNVTVTSGVYAVTLQDIGSGYVAGDTIVIDGSLLGGSSPSNDIKLNVLSTGVGGAVSTFEVLSGTGTGSGTYSDVGSDGTQGNTNASNGTVDITRNGGVYSVVVNNGGTGFNQFNRFLIPGSILGGVDTTNDAIVTVTTVSGGVITGVSVTGTAVRGSQISVFSTVAISESTTANIATSSTVTFSAIATIQASFLSAHGLVPGSSIMISITSTGTNHQLAGGPFSVEQVPSPTTIRYTARAPGTVQNSVNLEGVIYVRPDVFFSHRPFDGGVQLGTGGPQHGGQAIRQSKKYIRYQSGKGAMYNTGALFAPSFDLRSVVAESTSVGATITVETDDVDHGLQAGSTIRLIGITSTGFDGEYEVNQILDERRFRITATSNLSTTTAVIGSQAQMSLLAWHGAVVRSGPFDDQNGIFWQYDGQTLAVGRRSSTFQIAGTVSLTVNQNTVSGQNTRFLDQLQEGDRIVIRGMTHVVSSITNQTSMTVTPDWRGVNSVTGVKVCKITDIIIPQSEWNLDRCDGTGPSGYNIDVTKMQMIGIQFSWYGAGFIDWMLRGPGGDYTFCHRLKGNNLNTEAYMRTGNLPVRYEVLNEGARAQLLTAVSDSVTTLQLTDTKDFPEAGVVYVENELIAFTGNNEVTNQLTGCTRAAPLTNFAAGATRTYTAGTADAHNAGKGVILVSNTTSPIISHWGSAYLIDGLFDEDRGYIFSYTSTGNSISTTKNTVFLIRLAPSVSNAVTGDLGERELLNRAQLLLKAISITSDPMTTGTAGIVVEGVLNPQNYPINPADIGWQGLTGLSAGGQPSFAQIAPGGSVVWASGAIETTTTATSTAIMTNTVSVPNNAGYNRGAGTSIFFVLRASWEASGAFVAPTSYNTPLGGVVINDAKFPAGTTITGAFGPFSFAGFEYYQINTSRPSTQAVNANATVTLNLGGTSATVTNVLYFTQASWVSSGAALNTEVADAKFPANTRVSSVTGPLVFGSTTYYRATFTQNSTSATSAGGTITFKFGQPPYALPGETVFSFVANPGETATLELDELKELTTTAIGGRGAFPNGPDVLAINVYKVGGTAVNSNIILRWGEAQA
jgi:hypothetical protein